MSPRIVVVVLAALATAACGSGGASPSTSTALPTTAPMTAPPMTTAEPTTAASPLSATVAPPGIDGFWLASPSPVIFLQFELESGPGGIVGWFDSLSEGIQGLEVTGRWDGSAIELEIDEASGGFTGTLAADGSTLSGTLEFPGAAVPVTFERRTERFAFQRPQTPVPPFPYDAEDVVFANEAAGLHLAGTLTRPAGPGPFPGVVFVSGSGPQDRDETLLGHRPFAVLADAFARRGIASLRYDDRGVGDSGGIFDGSTPDDVAADAAAAIGFLSNQDRIDGAAVGIVGHSEGGMVAPQVALSTPEVSFIVLLAGPGVPGADVLVRQSRDLLAAEGMPDAYLDARMEWTEPAIRAAAGDAASEEVRRVIEDALAAVDPAMAAVPGVVESADEIAASLLHPWMRAFLRYDPRPDLGRMEIPVLALIGELDMQVSAEVNIPALETALGGASDATVMALDGLNHLFQHAETGAVGEYALASETFDPATIELIAEWILERFG